MTKEQYHALAPTFDRNKMLFNQAVNNIPPNINRAGKLYRRLLKELQQHYGQ